MKMRDSTLWHVGTARFLRSSFFLLVMVLGTEATPRAGPMLPRAGMPSPRPLRPHPADNATSPYLLAVGPPPLRFEQAPPPPDLSTRPATGAPPLPAVIEEMVATNTASARSVTPSRGSEGAAVDPRQTSPADSAQTLVEVPAKAPGKKEAPALLPDDTQRDIRPEEVLPFFQFPGSGGTTIVVPAVPVSPESSRLPVSSAVYRQH